jgi:hypothetical protein
MKNIVVLSFVFFIALTNGVKNDYIRIEYAGNTDKLMTAVYISKKPIPRPEMIMTIPYDDLPENYIVYNKEFLFIKKAINSTTKKASEEKDYNGFKITIRENNALDSCFITRQNSNSLFLKINAYLKNNKRNKDLISRVTNLRRMNVF